MGPDIFSPGLSRLGNMFPRSGPPPETEVGEDEAFSARLDAARDATIKSFRNRLGRDPSAGELRSALPGYLQSSDRDALDPARLTSDALLAGFRSRPTKRRQDMPPSPSAPPPPPDALVAAKTIASLLLNDRQGLANALENPITRGLVALHLFPMAKREVWLDGLGVDRSQMKAENAEVDEVEMLMGRVYDAVRGWDDRSFDIYGKRRKDDGPCIFSKDPKTGEKTCVYIGHTSGHGTSEENVLRRFSARYPTNQYDQPVAHRSTRSFGAALGEEDRGIKYYRDQNRSDNKYRAYSPFSPLGRYYRFQAMKEFGPFTPPFP